MKYYAQSYFPATLFLPCIIPRTADLVKAATAHIKRRH